MFGMVCIAHSFIQNIKIANTNHGIMKWTYSWTTNKTKQTPNNENVLEEKRNATLKVGSCVRVKVRPYRRTSVLRWGPIVASSGPTPPDLSGLCPCCSSHSEGWGAACWTCPDSYKRWRPCPSGGLSPGGRTAVGSSRTPDRPTASAEGRTWNPGSSASHPASFCSTPSLRHGWKSSSACHWKDRLFDAPGLSCPGSVWWRHYGTTSPFRTL